jgi:hypothetical protein
VIGHPLRRILPAFCTFASFGCLQELGRLRGKRDCLVTLQVAPCGVECVEQRVNAQGCAEPIAQARVVLFSLKPGRSARLVTQADRQCGTLWVKLDVKGTDSLYIDPCKYEVLKIEGNESRTGAPSTAAGRRWSSPTESRRRSDRHVRCAKNGKPSARQLRGDEVRALRELRRRYPDSAFVFATERGGPFTPDARISARSGCAFPAHVHMLRHACGYALANAGHDTRRIQDWLGHRSIQHTTRYTQLSAAPFKDFWRSS